MLDPNLSTFRPVKTPLRLVPTPHVQHPSNQHDARLLKPTALRKPLVFEEEGRVCFDELIKVILSSAMRFALTPRIRTANTPPLTPRLILLVHGAAGDHRCEPLLRVKVPSSRSELSAFKTIKRISEARPLEKPGSIQTSLTHGWVEFHTDPAFPLVGVLWNSKGVIPGAIALLDRLFELKRNVFLITNNSTKSVEQYSEKCRTLGLPVSAVDNFVVTS
ncbi:4-nitrophenyl phosphatase [Clonorchis sinensis]|uniref:4-nitrophenyl phosphatase n=1 Tax=Clonorchis sinensis TaxID=79923 RepID=G7YNF0_CLOSI|nr:4-nitrophenyl phosphatase [Clonorchis sinensis]